MKTFIDFVAKRLVDHPDQVSLEQIPPVELRKEAPMSSPFASRLLVSVLLLACVGANFAGCKKDSSPTGPSGGAGSVINVTGKVIGLNGQSAPGLPVFVTGKPSVNTDANGAFTIASVTVPYDITVVVGALKQAYIYRGISRSDPTLMFVGATVGSPNTANISGKIYPASAFPQPAGRVTNYAFIAAELTGEKGVANGAVSPATYSESLNWYGATSITGTLHGLQWDIDGSNLPTTYQLYGSRSGIVITNGGTFSTVNDTMTSTPATVTLSGTVTVSSGYTILTKAIATQFGGKTAFTLASDATPGTAFSFKTPNISGMTLELMATASSPFAGQTVAYKSGVSPSAANAALSIPTAPELSLPVDNATGVRTGAAFSWNAFPGGMHVLYFNGPAGQPEIYVMTMAANDSLPNLTSAGMPVPASTNYSWHVLGVAPFASMDAATASTGFLPIGIFSGVVEGTGSLGNSATRTFTTAP